MSALLVDMKSIGWCSACGQEMAGDEGESGWGVDNCFSRFCKTAERV